MSRYLRPPRRSAPSSAGVPPERAGFCALLFVCLVRSVFCIFASLVLLVGCFFLQPPILFDGRQENHLQFQLPAGHFPLKPVRLSEPKRGQTRLREAKKNQDCCRSRREEA